MDLYDRMIHAFAAARHATALQHALADQVWRRGDLVHWRRGAGWRSGVVIARGHGRRLFVADFQTDLCHWVAFDRLRSREDARLEIAQRVEQVNQTEAFSLLLEAA